MNKTMLKRILKKRHETEMRDHGPTPDDLNEDAKLVRDAMRREQTRHRDAMSDNTWVCFCFETEEAKRETLATLGVQVDSKYVLGSKLRAKVGLNEEAGPQRANQPRKVGRWVGLI